MRSREASRVPVAFPHPVTRPILCRLQLTNSVGLFISKQQRSKDAPLLIVFQISFFEYPDKALPVWSSARSTIPPEQKNQS